MQIVLFNILYVCFIIILGMLIFGFSWCLIQNILNREYLIGVWIINIFIILFIIAFTCGEILLISNFKI